MDAQSYEKIAARFRGRESTIELVDRALVVFVALSYVALVIWTFATAAGVVVLQDSVATGFGFPLRIVLVPAVSFILMSVARALINAPRPYEKLDIDPILHKDTKGKSFPGRHVFSAAVITTAFAYATTTISAQAPDSAAAPMLVAFTVALGIATVLIACMRVIGGVHFPHDVIWGAALGVACGIVGFWII